MDVIIELVIDVGCVSETILKGNLQVSVGYFRDRFCLAPPIMFFSLKALDECCSPLRRVN